MTRWILALFLLALAEPVGAEESNRKITLTTEPGCISGNACPENWQHIVIEKDPCLATMEAAMKAIEDFLPTFHKEHDARGTAHWRVERAVNESRLNAYTKSKQQWDAAKRECWGKSR